MKLLVAICKHKFTFCSELKHPTYIREQAVYVFRKDLLIIYGVVYELELHNLKYWEPQGLILVQSIGGKNQL